MRFWSLLLLCGFVVSLKEIGANEDEFQCPEEYRYHIEQSIKISSPFYGKEKEYRSGLRCQYRITAPERYRIKVVFEDFDLNPSDFCEEDQLRFLDASTLAGPSIFCGNTPPKTFLTGGNELSFSFKTGYVFSSGRRGFSLQAIATQNDSLCEKGFTQCGNRNCYDSSKKCNGIDDCGDGTDEEDCGLPISSTECGKPPITPNTDNSAPDRIVGGEVAKPHSWPWQVSFRVKNMDHSHSCGGTVLNSLWVLSAAHCFAGIPYPDFLEVHFGSHSKRENNSPFYQIRKAVKIIAYPDFEGLAVRNYSMHDDVALVKLNAPILFTDGVQPACLPEQGTELNIGDACFTSGWGETRGSGSNELLKQTKQVVVTEKECDYEEYKPATQICLHNYKNTPCRGDSGGPLVCKRDDGRWYVFGATSLATRLNGETILCATPDDKTIFAKISDKADWIKTAIDMYT
ncbi:plasminogen-like [Uloborus diversus]|uniref:plasminogen-like n=1 Tax=Uloborus diversus TaxID=327109 RepID=UPI00240A3EAE|nr:plasminogen-like [Uloborus diversus]